MRHWSSRPGFALFAISLLSFPLAAFAERGSGGEDGDPERGYAIHADGPPPAHTGGFGQPTCQECHQGSDLNTAPGVLTLSGLPTLYRPDKRYELTLTLKRPGMKAAGFQLAVRSEGLRRQAGMLAPRDDRTTVVADSIEYLQHSRVGTAAAGDSAQWRFSWSPPQGVGPVVFHIAANAANGDESPLDDFIYTRAIVLQVKP